jgi:hypothetical protein
MDVINAILLFAGRTVRIVVETVQTWLADFLSGTADLLDPVLSPLLQFINPACLAVGDTVFAVLSPCPAWLSLSILSVLLGVVMLICFKYLSNQPAIARARTDISANLLVLKLYKDDLGVLLKAQWRLLLAILRLQRYMLVPVVIMLAPMVVALAHVGLRYQWRPLSPGEGALVTLRFAGQELPEHVSMGPSPGVELEVGPVPGGDTVVWRIRGGASGRHIVPFDVDGSTFEKELVVGVPFERVSAVRAAPHWITQLLHPAEAPLPADSAVHSIEMSLPGVDSWTHGRDWWILHCFVVSMLAALLLKPVFKVTF